MPDALDAARAVGPYDGWLRGAITACKYDGEWARAEQLGALIAGVAADLVPFAALVPVPLHPTRLRQRGFNQSQLLAAHAASRLAVPVEEPLLRIRATEAQARLGARDRLQNVRNAFSTRPGSPILGRSFVLVDDVVTTGATLAACAAVLRYAGATWVSAATVAREME